MLCAPQNSTGSYSGKRTPIALAELALRLIAVLDLLLPRNYLTTSLFAVPLLLTQDHPRHHRGERGRSRTESARGFASLAEASGLLIESESMLDQGSSFTVRLPIEQAPLPSLRAK